MKPHFQYCLIGDNSAQHLGGKLDRGESAVIIGPPGAGKRYLLEYINLLRTRVGKYPYPIIAFGDSELICREMEVAQSLAVGSNIESCTSIEGWADAVRIRYATDRPLRLFMTNLDCMSKTLAHRLLSSIQSLVKAELLVTVVTGEGNLIDLVDGSPTSAWNCSHQFVVHAHDRRHFHRFLTKRMRQANLLFPKILSEAKKVFSELYRKTGGDVSLARAVLWGIGDKLNHHMERAPKLPTRIGLGHIPVKLTDTHIVPVAGVVPFRYSCLSILAAAKECNPVDHKKRSLSDSSQCIPVLSDLEKILWGGDSIMIGEEPHLLELAGMAKRNQGILNWFSPYTESFMLEHFSKRTVGDLFAFAHDWVNAYRLYAELPLEEKCRPLSDNDHVTLMRLVDGVAIRFHRTISEAGQLGLGNEFTVVLALLRSYLRQALNHLTGIPDERITCWTLDWQGTWVRTSDRGEIAQLPQQALSAWAALAHKGTHEEDELHSSQDGYHWVICRDHDDKPSSAVLIDGTDDPLRDHPMRTSVIHRILRGYRRARERQLLVERGLRERAEHEILKVFWMLTKDAAWEIESVLSAIAAPILKSLSSASRIVYLAFGHPRPEDRVLIPLHDTSEPTLKAQDYSSIKPPAQFAFPPGTASGFALTADFANTLLTETRLAPFQRSLACIILPGVKGLLLVEHAENQAFNQADMRFIKELGERIKPSWEQGLRLKLLHESIDANHSPSLLLDRNKRILFANQRACDLLALKLAVPGWQEVPVELNSLNVSNKVKEALTPSVSKESREMVDVTQEMNGTWLRECHPLDGKDGHPRGWVLTFRDRAFLYSSFGLIRKLEAMNEFESALKLILESIKKWLRVKNAKLRFYLCDPSRPNRLVGKLSLGLNEINTRRFEAGEVWYDNDPDEMAWLCIRERKPIALLFTKATDVGKEGSTYRGLKYFGIGWKSQFEVLERQTGDLSIDLPLLSEKSFLGKLTINFNAEEANELPAELPMQLGALSVVLGGLLDRVSQGEIRQKMIVTDAAQQALRTTAHNLLSQISPFAAFIARYRLRETKLPELKSINDDLSVFHEQACNSIRRLKDRISMVNLHLEEADLTKVVESALRTVVDERDEWHWEAIPKALMGQWDTNHLANVFIELAHNSRDFVKAGTRLIITLSQQITTQDGLPWITLRYADNGCGVISQLKKKIFDGRSYREEVDKQGRGIGLAYTRRVIEAHGGTIQEIGKRGDGAIFEIQMPIRTTADEPANISDSL